MNIPWHELKDHVVKVLTYSANADIKAHAIQELELRQRLRKEVA
jgi:hypothetical protein